MEKDPTLQFSIRPATPDDAAAARAMQAESWLAAYPSDENGVSYDWVKSRTDAWLTGDKLDESRQILKAVLNDPDQFYRVAEQGGKLVGFVHAATNLDGSKELEAIYTSPATFGRGLGDLLMAEVDGWIGGRATTLEVASYNRRAIRFYEKHGFTKIEGSEHLYRDKIPAIIMSREGITK